MILRIDPALAANVRHHQGDDGYFTTAVEEGLRLWLARERRRATKVSPRAASLPLGLLPDTPEEHERRGNAVEAMFRELVRRASKD